mmetsp:Transcript_15353/g.63771  ORF Transcript_15353/g.63771 Transcript_15353/m.63771 type:complete len:269 (+) Transcript_15353:1695-2501(+)
MPPSSLTIASPISRALCPAPFSIASGAPFTDASSQSCFSRSMRPLLRVVVSRCRLSCAAWRVRLASSSRCSCLRRAYSLISWCFWACASCRGWSALRSLRKRGDSSQSVVPERSSQSDSASMTRTQHARSASEMPSPALAQRASLPAMAASTEAPPPAARFAAASTCNASTVLSRCLLAFRSSFSSALFLLDGSAFSSVCTSSLHLPAAAASRIAASTMPALRSLSAASSSSAAARASDPLPSPPVAATLSSRTRAPSFAIARTQSRA